MYDSIIIGKGPAGITAGLYAKRGGKNVLIIGKDGGTLEKAEAIDNYYGFPETISGKQLIKNGIKQAQRLEIPIDTDEVLGINFDGTKYEVETRNKTYESKTVILATGSKRNTPKINGIKELEGKGVSYCAICDGFFYRGKDVTVLGSGDYALKEAKILSPIAKQVTILTDGKQLVENRSQLPENILIEEKEIEELRGVNKIEQIGFKDKTTLNTNGLFVAIGTASSTDLAKKIGVITNNNTITVSDDMSTNVPGLYACGDCTGGLLQISKAIYEGTMAGLSVVKFLKKEV